MRVKLVKIGNSTGVRLPKNIIQNCGFQSEVDLDVIDKSVVLKAPEDDRGGWSETFQNAVIQTPIKEKGEWEW